MKKLKKHKVILPSSFQEILLTKEIEFSNGSKELKLIRELLYLYSVY